MESINNFDSGKCQILIATDLGSRGLNFPNLEMVVMFEFPKDAMSFLHRVGRAGRFGKKGIGNFIRRYLSHKLRAIKGCVFGAKNSAIY